MVKTSYSVAAKIAVRSVDSATPCAGLSVSVIKTCGGPGRPAFSAPGTRKIWSVPVPTSKSPFGSPTSSRAAGTAPIVSEANPDATLIRGSVVGAGFANAVVRCDGFDAATRATCAQALADAPMTATVTIAAKEVPTGEGVFMGLPRPFDSFPPQPV